MRPFHAVIRTLWYSVVFGLASACLIVAGPKIVGNFIKKSKRLSYASWSSGATAEVTPVFVVVVVSRKSGIAYCIVSIESCDETVAS
jgi:hypothetical protein